MGGITRKVGHEPRPSGGLAQGGACPQCGFEWPRENVAGGGPGGGLAGGMEGVGQRLPSALGAMERARFPEKWKMSPGTMTFALPRGGGVAEREPARVAGAPQGAAGGGEDGRRAELVGTLARFIAYLGANGIPADAETAGGHHMLHLHAYIAKWLGMRLGYDFDFLETGAFSVELELDLFRMEVAGGGAEPFGGNARASAVFLDLVCGRDAKWLQAATLAMRELGRGGALEGFVAAPQGIIKYDEETLRDAFAGAEWAAGALAGAAP